VSSAAQPLITAHTMHAAQSTPAPTPAHLVISERMAIAHVPCPNHPSASTCMHVSARQSELRTRDGHECIRMPAQIASNSHRQLLQLRCPSTRIWARDEAGECHRMTRMAQRWTPHHCCCCCRHRCPAAAGLMRESVAVGGARGACWYLPCCTLHLLQVERRSATTARRPVAQRHHDPSVQLVLSTSWLLSANGFPTTPSDPAEKFGCGAFGLQTGPEAQLTDPYESGLAMH
jgi:hypothetical protein